MNDSANKYTKEEEKKIWFSEFMICLSKDTCLDMEQILLKYHRKKLSRESYSDFVSDSRLFYNGTLTLYGIYSIEPENKYIKWADKIIQYMKNDLLKNMDIKRTLAFLGISKRLKIPPLQLKVCFRLINTLPMRNYFYLLNTPKKGNECLTVGYANSDVKDYESIKSLFDDVYKTTLPKKTPIENDDDFTTSLRKVDLSDKLHITQGALSKKGSP
jgi:hypothetical protein